MTTEDQKYMARCIQLAQKGRKTTSPNPTVGAVIVHQGKVIGEGYHIRHGEAHAEVNAINSVKDKSLLKQSTIYVSLEPCSHYGKTPPCADLIIKEGIPEVVIGCTDLSSKVCGKGIKRLQESGVNVRTGVLRRECEELIKNFTVFNLHHRPYIILKWAESADHFIDKKRDSGSPFIFSTPLSSMVVHKRRAEVDGIMIGTNTAILDNPSLNTRNWPGSNPTRIVLDREQQLSPDLKLFDESSKTIVFTAKSGLNFPAKEVITINYKENILSQIMEELYKQEIQNLLVEGGNKLIQSFIDNDLWDEAYIESSTVLLKNGIPAPIIKDATEYKETILFGQQILHYKHTCF